MKKNLSKIADPGEGKLTSVLKLASFMLTKPGFNLAKKIATRALHRSGILKEQNTSYTGWIKAKTDLALLRKNFDKEFPALKLKPKISIVMPIAQQNEHFAAAINSVNDQLYDNWELVISGSAPALQIEHISIAHSADILPTTTGEYILFMAQDDLLTPDCLFELVKHINTHPADQMIYTDEDIITSNSTYSTPHFKPDWSPHSLLSRNYIDHTFAITREMAERINITLHGDNYYDLLLQATELTNNIGHIPKVLYHCHTHPFTSADNEAALNALNAAMTRRNTPAVVTNIPGTDGCYYIAYKIERPGKVSVIIPTKDNTDLLKTAIDSILQNTSYPDYEIIVLNNNSTSKEFFDLMQGYTDAHPTLFRCIDALFPFNFSKLMNIGFSESKGTYILMCNNDIKVINDTWMSEMVSHAQHEKTGAVGAKLLFPDGTIQHAGIVLGIDGASRHILANKAGTDSGYFNCLKAVTNYSAVTAACMMCRKDTFIKAGGMDETLAVEFNDLDLCLKFLTNGYYNVYLPSVELYHYESATRGHPFRSKASWQQHEKESEAFTKKWHRFIDNDPFYNPNLSRTHTDFRLRPLK